jgi:serine/threonine-protein kinase HipA
MPLAFEVAGYFGLGPKEARQVAGQVAKAVAGWRVQAKKLGLRAVEIERMASAFEHEELRATQPGSLDRKRAG